MPCSSLVYCFDICWVNPSDSTQFSHVDFHSQLKLPMNRMHVVIACISFIFTMLSQDGREVCAIHAKKCPQIPAGSRRMERRNGWVGSCSTRLLLCDSETLGLTDSAGWPQPCCHYAEVGCMAGGSRIRADQGRLSKAVTHPRVPAKVICFQMLFLSWIMGRDFSLSPPPLCGPGNSDIPSTTAGEEPAPRIRFHGPL